METLNFNGKELRKTIWSVIFGIALIKIISMLPELIVLLMH
ncbi:hypothetical protein [Phocoenobacter skyensis]|nr:hypothetical protein [Pasteurella skyensis]